MPLSVPLAELYTTARARTVGRKLGESKREDRVPAAAEDTGNVGAERDVMREGLDSRVACGTSFA